MDRRAAAKAARSEPTETGTMVYLQLAGGLLLLLAGGEALVRGGVDLARRAGVSPLMIGLTLIGFGTSTPELVTSLQAALAGSPGIAVGNVVGSNSANILLILGLAALLHPLATSRELLYRDGGAMLLAAVACVLLAAQGTLSRPIGGVLLALLLAYVVHTYRRERRVRSVPPVAAPAEGEAVAAGRAPLRLRLCLLLVLGGLALTIGGARLLVAGTMELALTAGLSETLLGLTVVAVGTSLPELVTSLVAALRRQADIALGNVIGSNIYNILGILGATALVQPIPVPAEILRLDVWVMLAATLALLIVAAARGRIGRVEGALLLSSYLVYLGFLIHGSA